MKLVAISGSLRKGSYNTALLRALAAEAPADVELELHTIAGIPVYNGDDEAASGKPEVVKALDAAIRQAQGVVISTAEYNFGIPGGLKNASDWLSRHGSPLNGKPVGVMGAAQGPVGTARVQYDLRRNLQAHEAIVMPKPEIFVGNAHTKFNDSGELIDEPTRQHLAKWLAAFVSWVEKVG